MTRFTRWRFRELVFGWIAYWVAAAVVFLGPPALAIFEATRAKGPSRVEAGAGDAGLNLHVFDEGVQTYAGSASFAAIALIVAGPPLLMWGVWMYNNTGPRKPKPAAPDAIGAGEVNPFGADRVITPTKVERR